MKATLHIETCCKDGITILRSSYCTQPFKLANVTEDKKTNELRLMLMSSSPGVLDGDEYIIKLDVGEKSVVHLETQSFQRLFRMKNGARQSMEIRLGRASSFCFIPHPSVPHEASYFTAKNKIFLTEGCSLIWGEVLTCGRKLHNEVFSFAHFHSCTEIFLKDKLVVKENLFIRPSQVDMMALGKLEGYTHQASLIFIREDIDEAVLVENFAAYLSTQENIEFGITELPVQGLLVRMLGYKGEQLFACLKQLSQIAKTESTEIRANQKTQLHVE